MQPLSGTCSNLMLMVDSLGDSAMMQVGRQMAEKVMATVPVNNSREHASGGKLISYEDALNSLSTDQRFSRNCLCDEYVAGTKGHLFACRIRVSVPAVGTEAPQFMSALGHYLSSVVA
jgi:hypothetical protein